MKQSFRSGWKKVSAKIADEVMSPNEPEMRSVAQIQTLPPQQIEDLQAQNDEYARNIADLRRDLSIEVEKNGKNKESANKMAYAIENKDLYLGHQDSDDAVYTRFKILIGQIKTWSVPFAQDRPPSPFKFTPEMSDDLRNVAPAVKDFTWFLKTSKNLRLFVRGYVSFAMTELIFRTLPTQTRPKFSGDDIWMDKELASGVFSIENRLFNAGEPTLCDIDCVLMKNTEDRRSISSREFHDWRALTTTLISRLKDASSTTGKGMEDHVTNCKNQIMHVVGEWVATEKRRTLEDGLTEILLQAVKLSQTLRCQRAY